MHKMREVRLSFVCNKSHQCPSSPFIHSVVSNDYQRLSDSGGTDLTVRMQLKFYVFLARLASFDQLCLISDANKFFKKSENEPNDHK